MREIPRRELWVCVPLALAALVYRPVLGDYFKFDDFLHLYEIANHGFAEAVLKMHGGHLLLATNLVFQACYALFGVEPAGYQALAYATHLLNVALLFALIRRLGGSVGLALFGASLWGTSPIGIGSVYWYSVYGQLLATAFSLALALDVAGRAGAERIGAGTWARWCTLAFAASVSFGTGLGVGLGFGVAAALLLERLGRRGAPAAVFGGLALGLVALYLAQGRLYAELSPLADPGALIAEQTAPALGSSLLGVGELLLHLAAFGLGGLALGPALAWVGEGAVWIAAALVGAGLAAAAWRADATTRRRLAALLWIALCANGIVALGRSWLQQGLDIPLASMAAEPRYHYLSTAFLAAALCLALHGAGVARAGWARVALALWLVVSPAFSVYAARSVLPANGEAAKQEHRELVAWIRSEVQRAAPGADVHLPNRAFRTVALALVPREEFPGAAAVYVISFPANVLDGRRVFFVERDRRALEVAAARPGTRIAGLLISPEERARRVRGGGDTIDRP